MLQSLHKGAKSWIARVLFGLLILSFAGWGVQGVFGLEQDPEVISVGDESVRLSDVDAVFRQNLAQMRRLFGDGLTYQQAIDLGLLDQALDQLTADAVLNALTSDLGLSVGTEVVLDEIREDPAFHGPNGQFDPNTFRFTVEQSGLSEQGLIALYQRGTARQYVLETLQDDLALPKSYVRHLAKHALEKRVFNRAKIRTTDISGAPVPDSSDLATYYTEHLTDFTAPEQRTFHVLDLTVNAIAQTVTIPESDIRAEFEFRSPNLGSPEMRTVNQIVLQEEETAKQVVAETRQGKSLEQIALQNALPAPIRLENIEPEDVDPDLASVVFKAEAETVVGPVKTPFGWHVVHVLTITPGTDARLEDYEEIIRQDLATQQATDRLFDLTSLVEDDRDQGMTLKMIADKHSLALRQIQNIDGEGRLFNTDGLTRRPDRIDQMFGRNSSTILRTAFSMDAGQISDIIDGNEGGYFVIELNAIDPSRQIPKEDIQPLIRAAWEATWKKNQAVKLADDVARAIMDTSRVPSHPAIDVETFEPVTRDQTSSGLTSADLDAGFGLEKGQATSVPDLESDDLHVIFVTEIEPAEGKDITAAMTTIQDSEDRQIQLDILAQLRTRMSDDMGVAIDRQSVRSFYLDPIQHGMGSFGSQM